MSYKYDWSNIPKVVEWIATDVDKTVVGFMGKNQPSKSNVIWYDGDALNCKILYIQAYGGNWEDSLEQRPKEFGG